MCENINEPHWQTGGGTALLLRARDIAWGFFFFRIHLCARWGTEPYVALHELYYYIFPLSPSAFFLLSPSI